jgi:hypothetical protein
MEIPKWNSDEFIQRIEEVEAWAKANMPSRHLISKKRENPIRIFISYRSKSYEFALLLEEILQSNNIQTFLDKHNLPLCRDWRKEIDDAIENSDIVIVIFDKYTTRSQYVTYEWAYAFGKGKKIIPILFEWCKPHKRLEPHTYLDFTENTNRPWEKLIKECLK